MTTIAVTGGGFDIKTRKEAMKDLLILIADTIGFIIGVGAFISLLWL